MEWKKEDYCNALRRGKTGPAVNITKLTTQLLWQVAQTLKPNVHTDLQTNSVQGLYAMDPDEALQNPQHEMSCLFVRTQFLCKAENKK